MAKKFSAQKTRVRAMTWIPQVSPWSTARPVRNLSSIQLSLPDTWWEHLSLKDPQQGTDTTFCHPLNNVTFLWVVNHKSKWSCLYIRRFIMGWTGGSRFSADSSRYSSTVVQSSNAIEGTKSFPAGNLCAPGWWLIPSICFTSANQSESLFLSVYTFHPVTPSEEQRSPFPNVGRLFSDRTYQVWLVRPSLWLKRQRALRMYHAVPHVSFYFRAMSVCVTLAPSVRTVSFTMTGWE